MVADLASILEVSSKALDVPDIDSYEGLLHTLLSLEDMYGLKMSNIDGALCLTLDKSKGAGYVSMLDMFSAWQKESEKLKNEEIAKEEYDVWRYNYPCIEAERTKQRPNKLRAEKENK